MPRPRILSPTLAVHDREGRLGLLIHLSWPVLNATGWVNGDAVACSGLASAALMLMRVASAGRKRASVLHDGRLAYGARQFEFDAVREATDLRWSYHGASGTLMLRIPYVRHSKPVKWIDAWAVPTA